MPHDGLAGGIRHLLTNAARTWPRRTAVSDVTASMTFAELHDASTRFAAGLSDRGVRPGDRVVARTSGRCRDIAVLFGCLLAGVVYVPVATQVPAGQLARIVQDCSPAEVVADPAELAAVASLSSSVDKLASPDLDAPVFLLYTSGSTGTPKAVVCPDGPVTFALEAIHRRLRYRPDDVVLNRIPLSFDYGLYQVLLSTLAGAEVVLAGDVSDTRLLSVIRTRGVTVMPVVPTLARMLIALQDRDGVETTIRLFTNTGEALPPETAAALRDRFPSADIQVMYGTTECKRVSIMEPNGELVRPGSVGRPLDGTFVTVVDDDGVVLAAGKTGQFVVSGPHVMAGYWADPSLTAGVFAPDGLRTGDYGWADDEGYLYLVGRRDTMFKRRGVRTSAVEIESVTREVTGVQDAVAIPPDDAFDLVVVYTGATEEDAVLDALRERLEPAKLPVRCVRVDRLPLTANGKVDRAGVTRSVREPV